MVTGQAGWDISVTENPTFISSAATTVTFAPRVSGVYLYTVKQSKAGCKDIDTVLTVTVNKFKF